MQHLVEMLLLTVRMQPCAQGPLHGHSRPLTSVFITSTAPFSIPALNEGPQTAFHT